MVHTLDTSLSVGEIGENIVRQYLEKRGYTVGETLSISQQIDFGYDFQISKEGKPTTNIEVKYEVGAGDSNCLFWEVQYGDRPGWTQRYPVDSKIQICWVLPHLGELWFFPAKQLKEIHYEDFEIRYARNLKFTSIGRLVPLSFMRSKCLVKKYAKVAN